MLTTAAPRGRTRSPTSRALEVFGALALLAAGCSSPRASTAPDSGGRDPADASAPVDAGPPGPTPDLEHSLRRLTDWEYRHTVADVLGVDPSVLELPRDIRSDGFSNNADGLFTSSAHVEAYFLAAPAVVRGIPDYDAFLAQHTSCRDATEACMGELVTRAATRLYRRPPDAEEHAELTSLFSRLTTDESLGFEDASRYVLESMLQSPGFLYRIERRAGASDGFELASRLSYFLHGSAPDDELLRAAAEGELESEAGLAAALERLLADPRAERGPAHLAGDWLRLAWVPPVVLGARDLYDRGPEIQESAMRMVADNVAAEHALADLLIAERVWINAGIAPLYGEESRFPDGASHPGGDPYFFDTSADDLRTGMLTHPAFLAGISDETGESIVSRGVFLLSALFCVDPGAPPADVDTGAFLDDFPESATERDMSDARAGIVPCGACHRAFDPLAYPLEPFDRQGRHRAANAFGNPYRTEGSYALGAALLEWSTPHEFAALVRESSQVRECVTRRAVQFALGRRPEPEEADELRLVHERAWAEGGSYVALARAIVSSPLFRDSATTDPSPAEGAESR